MAQELESDEYDVVILGTGLAESIAAAALAKAGKSVLHLDPNEYYGSAQASLTLDELVTYISSLAGSSSYPHTLPESLKNDRRRYALSLYPSILPSRGNLIDTLIASDVSKYVSFRMLDSVSMWSDDPESSGTGRLRRVPGSKEEVFKDQSVSLMDKRKLMRFLMLAAGEYESSELVQGKEEQPLLEFLTNSIKLPIDLAASVAYAIAHCSSPLDPLLPALERTRRYLLSVGRYGSGAFLVGQYGGAGEVAQGFCRACAVYGGTYVLGTMAKPSEITLEDQMVKLSLPCHPRPITTRHIVTESGALPPNLKPDTPQKTVYWAQGIAILTSLPPAFKRERSAEADAEDAGQEEKEDDDTALVIFPPVDERPAVRALLMGEGTGSCPPGQYVLYLSATVASAQTDPSQLLKPYLQRLVEEAAFESYFITQTSSFDVPPATLPVSRSDKTILLNPYGGDQLLTEGLDWEAAQGRAAYEAIMGTEVDVREFFEKLESEGEGEAGL